MPQDTIFVLGLVVIYNMRSLAAKTITLIGYHSWLETGGVQPMGRQNPPSCCFSKRYFSQEWASGRIN
jgi:hypothetical protein